MNNLRPKSKNDIALGDIINFRAFNESHVGCLVVAFEHESDDYNSTKVYALCVLPDAFDPQGRSINKYKNPLPQSDYISIVSDHNLYLGKYCVWKTFSYIDDVFEVIPSPASSMCIGCKIHFEWAAPNQSDNTFKCYSCRQNPARAYY